MVKLYGIVSRGLPTLVLMEYMQNRDLKNYLRERRPEEALVSGGGVTGDAPGHTLF